jgi:magnesium-transporting ATPase (P-type)
MITLPPHFESLLLRTKTFIDVSDGSETNVECDLIFIGLFASIDPERKEVSSRIKFLVIFFFMLN